MARKEDSPKLGRPKESKSRELRIEVLKMLYDKHKESTGNTILTYNEVEKNLNNRNLQVNRKTTRSLLNEVAVISTDITLVPDGILLRPETYYHNSLKKYPGLKYDIANEFVEVLHKNADLATLACSAGSTVAISIKRLVEKRRYHVIVTNNFGIIDQLRGIVDVGSIIICGGEYNAGLHGCIGNQAVEAFDRAKCEAAVIGVSGINGEGELFVRHCEEIGVNQQILKSVTKYVFIVADVNKLVQEDTWRCAVVSDLLQDEKRPDLRVFVITNPIDKLPEKKKLKEQAKKVCEALQNIKRVEVIFAE